MQDLDRERDRQKERERERERERKREKINKILKTLIIILGNKPFKNW